MCVTSNTQTGKKNEKKGRRPSSLSKRWTGESKKNTARNPRRNRKRSQTPSSIMLIGWGYFQLDQHIVREIKKKPDGERENETLV